MGQKVFTIGYGPVEHGVKRRDLIDAHGWHVQHLRDIVHDADARPSFVLPLAKIQKRNHCSLLVLRRIARDDFLCTPEVVWSEREGYLLNYPGGSVRRECIACNGAQSYFGVVIVGVAVLESELWENVSTNTFSES